MIPSSIVAALAFASERVKVERPEAKPRTYDLDARQARAMIGNEDGTDG